ncbi:MAG: acetylornithine/succinylornithine family transaminase [Spirochaetaceae bacterium]|nr:acetylornithine/succinylornithine family transaminase [Spirochaetaceae bacterium]
MIANNYGSLPVVFKSGEGSTLTDINKKKYIDFVSGIGVNCLGHGHPALVKAIKEQVEKQIHISNYYNSDQGLAFAKELLEATKMDRVYFGNSGAEANEAAIKLARKYGWLSSNGSKNKNVIVTLEKSFHGRTLATLRATGQEKFHADCFSPYPEGFRHITAGDYEALETVFDDSVCAFMLECVQGEGGVNLVDKEWAMAAANAARKAGAIVICDEVQTGMGRTGTLLASDELGIEPEVVTLAKGIAGGVPMGACLFRGKAKDVFVAGDHQSTFGGNPLACSAGRAVLSELSKPDFLKRVSSAGETIRNTISGWNLSCVKQVRGKGLMIGVDVTMSSGEIQKKCLEAGLCISTAGVNTLRFLPPLVITDEEIMKGLEILYSVLNS